MSNASDFVIENGVLKKYVGLDDNVIIPENVTKIGAWAFGGCAVLKSVILHQNIVEIGQHAFGGCKELIEFDLHGCKATLTQGVFGNSLPAGLIPHIDTLCTTMDKGAILQYVLTPPVWKTLSAKTQAEIYFSNQGKDHSEAYRKCISTKQINDFAMEISRRMKEKANAGVCDAAGTFMQLFSDVVPAEILRDIYSGIQLQKSAAKTLKRIQCNTGLMKALASSASNAGSQDASVKKGLIIAAQLGITETDVQKRLKEYYSVEIKLLPVIKSIDNQPIPPAVFAWLLTAHEELTCDTEGKPAVVAAFSKPGLCPEAAELAAMLDPESLQKAMQKLADENLGLHGRSKKMFLAYPICRYAGEAVMARLNKEVPSWRSGSGKDTPSIATLRKACLYSNTRAAALLSYRYGDLSDYADVRGMTEEQAKETVLVDLGLDENGNRTFEYGEKSIRVKLTRTFSIELFDNKTGKQIRALSGGKDDPDRFETVKAVVQFLRDQIKFIRTLWKNRLLEAFLSAETFDAEKWEGLYLHNAFLRMVTSLHIWEQGGVSFTLGERGLIRGDETAYTLTDQPIRLTHPMDLTDVDLAAWQKYVLDHGIRQLFEQVWEPVVDKDTVFPDRYQNCTIPVQYCLGRTSHGIIANVSQFDGWYGTIEFSDVCEGYVSADDKVHMKEVRIREYNRKVNHVLAYLDRLTVWERIRNDEPSVIAQMGGFSFAQIIEFIAAAQEANATKVLAALLEYKNARFPDYNPMDEFTLEW